MPQRITDSSGAAASGQAARPRSARCSRRRPTGSAPAASAPLDVEAELGRLLAEPQAGGAGIDPGLVEEVRQLVVARNERRARQGKEPLDVDEEVQRQLRELENLGQ